MLSTWEPLFVGADAKPYQDCLEEIMEAVRPASYADAEWGPALLNGYYFGDERHACCDGVIDEANVALANAPSLALYGGFAGIGWLAAHLNAQFADKDSDSDYADIDATLKAEVPRWEDSYDLVRGLVGLGVYLLERLPSRECQACLALIAERLENTAVETGGGILWFTPPALIAAEQRGLAPHGYFDLGVAHGNAGVIALLAKLRALDIDSPRVSDLLERAVPAFLCQRTSPLDGFPYWTGPNPLQGPKGLSWCYGDLGIAASLHAAGRNLGNEELIRAALELARNALQRATDRMGVGTACLCHGASGIAHLFNRLYQASGDASFGRAARHYYQETLRLRRPGEGLAGFVDLYARDVTERQRRDAAFLSGVAGVGLALLAAVRPQEPQWDRVLLVS